MINDVQVAKVAEACGFSCCISHMHRVITPCSYFHVKIPSEWPYIFSFMTLLSVIPPRGCCSFYVCLCTLCGLFTRYKGLASRDGSYYYEM